MPSPTQQTAAAAASVGTWGFNAGVQLDVDAVRTTTTEKTTTARAPMSAETKLLFKQELWMKMEN